MISRELKKKKITDSTETNGGEGLVGRGRSEKRDTKNKNRGRSQSSFKKNCHYCHRDGHFRRECPERKKKMKEKAKGKRERIW